MPSKKHILNRLREIEKNIAILKYDINEHYGQETKSENHVVKNQLVNDSSPDIKFCPPNYYLTNPFCLSDRIVEPDNKEGNNGFYWEEDIREFIKILKKELKKKADLNQKLEYVYLSEVNEIINKLMGDELK